MKYWHRGDGVGLSVDCSIESTASSQARKALRQRNFDVVESFVSSQKDVNDRCHALESLADWPGDFEPLAEWAQQHPSTHSNSAAAIQRVKWAWEARGGGAASTVSDDAANSFFGRLDIAKAALLKVLKADSKDASAIPWLISCGRGMGDDDLSEKAFAEGQRRQPGLRACYSSMLISKAARWGGSADQQIEFARTWADKAPASSGAAVLLVHAHDMVSEDTTDTSQAAAAYWQRPSVVSDVTAAHEASSALPKESINTVYVRQWLAYGLWRCGKPALAKLHFQAVDKGFNDMPWYPFRRGFNWLFSPLRKARKESLRA